MSLLLIFFLGDFTYFHFRPLNPPPLFIQPKDLKNITQSIKDELEVGEGGLENLQFLR